MTLQSSDLSKMMISIHFANAVVHTEVAVDFNVKALAEDLPHEPEKITIYEGPELWPTDQRTKPN